MKNSRKYRKRRIRIDRVIGVVLSICMILANIGISLTESITRRDADGQNGVVTAMAEDAAESGHVHKVCCDKTYYGHSSDNCEHGDITWQAWGDGDGEAYSLPTEPGYYYITKKIIIKSTETQPWHPADGTYICLNGYTIRSYMVTDSFIIIDSGKTFTITNCRDNRSYIEVREADGAKVVMNYGTLELYEGFIGGTSGSCGGVYNKGEFHMYSGGVDYNGVTNVTTYTYKSFGGVYNDGTSARVVMYGGEIYDNCTETGGGGIYNNNGTVIMYDGWIRQNRKITNSDKEFSGGGVYQTGSSARFYMYGGKITGNESSLDGGNVYIGGGSQFTMYDGYIGGGTHARYGTDVCIMDAGSTFNLRGGTISDSTTGPYGTVYAGEGTTLNISGGRIESTKQYDKGLYIENINKLNGKWGNCTIVARESSIVVHNDDGGSVGKDELLSYKAALYNMLAAGAQFEGEVTFTEYTYTNYDYKQWIDAKTEQTTIVILGPYGKGGKLSSASLLDVDYIAAVFGDGNATYDADTNTITLNSDVTLEAPLEVDSDITLNLNGHVITAPDGADGGSSSENTGDGSSINGADTIKVTQDNVTINITNTGSQESAVLGGDGGDAVSGNADGGDGGDAVNVGNSVNVTVKVDSNVTLLGGSGGDGSGTGSGGSSGSGVAAQDQSVNIVSSGVILAGNDGDNGADYSSNASGGSADEDDSTGGAEGGDSEGGDAAGGGSGGDGDGSEDTKDDNDGNSDPADVSQVGYKILYDVKPVNGVSITADMQAIAEENLTEQDKTAGNTITFTLIIERLSDETYKDEALKELKNISATDIGAYYDIKLTKTTAATGSDVTTYITETTGQVSITMNIPDDISGGSNYQIIRVHKSNDTSDMQIQSLGQPQSGDSVTFETNKFSTYVLAYTPKASGSGGGADNSGDSGNSGNSGDSGNSGNSGGSGNSSNSGDLSNSGNSVDSGNSGNSGDSGNSGGGDGSNGSSSSNGTSDTSSSNGTSDTSSSNGTSDTSSSDGTSESGNSDKTSGLDSSSNSNSSVSTGNNDGSGTTGGQNNTVSSNDSGNLSGTNGTSDTSNTVNSNSTVNSNGIVNSDSTVNLDSTVNSNSTVNSDSTVNSNGTESSNNSSTNVGNNMNSSGSIDLGSDVATGTNGSSVNDSKTVNSFGYNGVNGSNGGTGSESDMNLVAMNNAGTNAASSYNGQSVSNNSTYASQVTQNNGKDAEPTTGDLTEVKPLLFARLGMIAAIIYLSAIVLEEMSKRKKCNRG